MFIKNAANVLAQPIFELCNLSIKLNSLPRSCKTAEVKPLLQEALRPILKTITIFHFSPCYQKLLKALFMTKQMSFWVTIKLSTDFNWVSKKNYSTNTCLWHLTDKITTKFEKIHFHWNDFNWFKKAYGTTDHQILLKKLNI